MAHGCISSSFWLEVEDVGDQVWKELVLRSFFQEINTSEGETTFKMHDLVHDLAQSIMENKIPGAETKGKNTSTSNSNIREVHYSESSDDQTCSSSIALEVSTINIIMNFNRLRFLKLVHTEMKELPSAIGKLKHLRCLDLSYSSFHTLPHTLCGLWNLQILILTHCGWLKSLPKSIRYMTNLRHILLEGCWELSDIPSRIGELVSLQTLSLFIVGDKIGNQLDELEHLNLGGRLEIKHLERVSNHLNSKKANLVEKPNLRDLVLDWESERTSSELTNMMDDEKVLEALEPHVNLETLKINGYKGGEFPLWMIKMENLTEIFIGNCPNCSHLPQLGDLPRLRSLILRHLTALEYINEEDEIGVFPSLELLELENLPNLKGFVKKEVGEMMFPNLRRLYIIDCELLILPPLSALKELSVRECSLLTLSSLSYCKLENLSYLRLELNENNCIPEDALVLSYDHNHFLRIERAGQHRLPEEWYQGLKSVKRLYLTSCKIGSSFPNGWLRHFTALEELRVESCSELVEMGEEIQYLHLLKYLSLHGGDEMVSLPLGWQLIPTLQYLSLDGLLQLTSLPDWLGNLTSLADLFITDCPKLSSLPSTIKGMENLRYLYIEGCPELGPRCEREKGEDWHIIAHIPRLVIFP